MSALNVLVSEASHLITRIQDFPKPGIVFRDVWPIIGSHKHASAVYQIITERFLGERVDVVVGIEARGYPIGQAVAERLRASFVPARKAGKLPGKLIRIEYGLEYNHSSVLEMQETSIRKGQRVLVMDDVLATGGTVLATAKLVTQLGGIVVGFGFMVDLGLGGAEKLEQPHYSPFNFNGEVMTLQFPQKVQRGLLAPFFAFPPVKLFLAYHPTVESLAQKLFLRFPQLFEKLEVKWRHFPDGTPNIEFDADAMVGKRVVFLSSLKCSTLMEQFSLAFVLPRQHIASLDLIYPFMPTATNERVERRGILATAEPHAKLISNIPMTASGPSTLRIFDIHALPEQFYFTDNVVPRLMSAINEIKTRMNMRCSPGGWGVAFPDDGAFKRFKNMFSGIPYVVCSKVRDGDNRKVKVTESAWNDTVTTVLVVDDLIQTGGTLVECQKAVALDLESDGKKFSYCAYATHAVFPNDCYDRFFPGNDRGNIFDTVYVTDSHPEVSDRLIERTPFRVISIANEIKKDILLLRCGTTTLPSCFISLSSSNTDKIKAVKEAFKLVYDVQMEVVSHKSDSKVPPQPVGLNQIKEGATQRVKDLAEKPSVGMENGIIHDDGIWYDIGCVCLKVDEELHYGWTRKVPIPQKYIDSFFRKEHETVGKAIAHDLKCSDSNWHYTLHKMHRSFLLAEALEDILVN